MLLYHMLSSEYAMKNLERQRLKISRINDLNDPFELRPFEETDKSFQQAQTETKDQMSESYGVLCFSKEWNNPVLWSHYGDKHKGMCLGFEVTVETKPIEYVTKRPRFNGNTEEATSTLLSTKYKHWEYEKEVRVYTNLRESAENGLFFYPFDSTCALREVILGVRCSELIERVSELVRSIAPDISVKKARLDDQEFKVILDEQ
jgi:hypothetical protein